MAAGGIVFDVSQVLRLEANLGKVAGSVVAPISAVVLEKGTELVDVWKSNATASSGSHGRLYPGKIQGTMHGGIGSIKYEAKPTVDWSFEYGSTNQPPHLDGLKAYEAVAPGFTTAVAAAAVKTVTL
jgi:hypothetical protein